MNRNANSMLFVIASVALASVFFAGCGDSLVASGVRLEQESGGEGTLTVPGSGGALSTDDLTFYDKIKIIVQDSDADPEIVTTLPTLGTWPDGKYHVQGVVDSSANLDSGGFTNTVVVYYDEPLTGDFKISARVRMTANAGLSTGKGFHMGTFAPQIGENSLRLTRTTLTLGTLFRTSNGSGALPAIRFYYSTDIASDTAVNFHAGTNGLQEFMVDLDWKREYVYEVARRGNEYIMTILNGKTYTVERTTTLPETRNNDNNLKKIHPRLINNNPVYAGICLMATSAEISEIRVWDKAEPDWDYETESGDDEPVYDTPRTTPAYVPASDITMVANPNVSPTNQTYNGKPIKRFGWTSDFFSNTSNTITLTPSCIPAWADENIYFQWFTISSHDAMELEGINEAGAGAEGTTWEQGKITINMNLLQAGNNDAVFLAVARNPDLDTPEIMESLNYSLLQTLPEYYFLVRIFK